MKPVQILFCVVLVLMSRIVFAQSTSTESVAASEKVLYGNNATVGKYADIRGFKMYYEIYGTGKPMLIIHGNGGSIKHFKFQIPHFAKNYKVILADSRAQGKSADPGDSLTYEMMADDLNALLTTLQVDSCYVIGWSDGGINGLLLAMRHPEKVKKLAITGANLWPDTTAVESGILTMAMDDRSKLAKAPQTPETKNSKKLLDLLIDQPHLSVKSLKQVHCPTLVIGGDNDVILPEHTLAIAKALPKSYLWILPNSGHSTPIRYRDLFNQIVGDFFALPYRKAKGVEQFN